MRSWGAASASTSVANLGFDTTHGVAGELGLQLGGAVAENVLVGAHFWANSAFSPTIKANGVSLPTGGDSLVAFRYTGQGFVPARIEAKPLADVNPITFLGQQIAAATRLPARRRVPSTSMCAATRGWLPTASTPNRWH